MNTGPTYMAAPGERLVNTATIIAAIPIPLLVARIIRGSVRAIQRRK